MTFSSQEFESYLPVYDAVPEKWEDARGFFVEQLKRIAQAVNVREIGFFIDEEVLSGKAFIPSSLNVSGTSEQFRTILRKTFLFGPIIIGVNTTPHGVVVDANFKLIQEVASGTNIGALTGDNIPAVGYDVNNIIVTSTKAYDACVVIFEYIQEL